MVLATGGAEARSPATTRRRELLTTAVNWSEVTAIATSILALGLVGGFVAAAFAAQQVREARRSREAQMAAEFFRRWDEDSLVEARRLVGRFKSAEELRDAFAAYVAADAPEGLCPACLMAEGMRSQLASHRNATEGVPYSSEDGMAVTTPPSGSPRNRAACWDAMRETRHGWSFCRFKPCAIGCVDGRLPRRHRA